ncbi:glyoxalase [Ciceribacter sp. L1K23]|uniref:VOC family protein n=1 Tax=Ciceribacter sp. L1K23 TaxID=2820276 RepID=UPI001B829E36|nr:VOC family protein [Ciceribacter sp. L1K23]MBR0554832.1 glyoxalase [Ciceribacter sp. L1K23]
MNEMSRADFSEVDVMPILPSLNFSQTRDFYVNALGFEQKPVACEDYIVFRRGRMELQFWQCEDPLMSSNSSVFIRCNSVSSLYEELVARGIDGVMRTAEDDGGIARFYVRDPHGNLLLFGQRETGSL